MANQRDDFATHVGEPFRAHTDEAEWRLVAVSERRRYGDFESFSIEFETPAVTGQQGMITLEHPDMGELELFVVAVGPGRYEAVFNQLVSENA